MSYGFAATCERCGNSQFLEQTKWEKRIGYNGSFVCDDCGGLGITVVRERPVRSRSTRSTTPRPKRPKVEAVPGPKCCLNNGPLPTYFRRCPDCPIPS